MTRYGRNNEAGFYIRSDHSCITGYVMCQKRNHFQRVGPYQVADVINPSSRSSCHPKTCSANCHCQIIAKQVRFPVYISNDHSRRGQRCALRPLHPTRLRLVCTLLAILSIVTDNYVNCRAGQSNQTNRTVALRGSS
jgi:hypothetical protein